MSDDRTYVKLHDGFDEHPKVAGLSDKAFRTYVETLCYCSRNLTDGRISFAVARKLAPPRVFATLIEVGLFERHDDYYAVHDYLEHQRSAEQVRQLKEARREAGRRGGKAKANGLASARGVASDLPKQTPSKALPDTEADTDKKTSSSYPSESDDDDRFNEFWRHYPKKEAKADARKAWGQVTKKIDPQTVIDGVAAYAFNPDRKFVPLPASWLRGQRWEDERPKLTAVPSNPHAGMVEWIEINPGRWQQAHPDGFYMGKRSQWLPVGQRPA